MTRTAAIIGGGVIGAGWAARFVLNGWNVHLYDPKPDTASRVRKTLANARRALPMLYDRLLPPEGEFKNCPSLSQAVDGADWVQESVPEVLSLKHKVLHQIEAACPAAALIGSSTSGFKPSDLQKNAAHPSRIFVAHPFNPVYLLPVVELVASPQTDSKTTSAARDTLTELGMHPIEIKKEIEAHVADRLLEAIWREALWLIKDDIATTKDIDDLIRYGFGLRWAQMGLFETYRIAGGADGLPHFLEQFGPCLSLPWTKLTNVPDLTPELIGKIVQQSDAQSGSTGSDELEQLRDDNLVAILRALKGRDAAVGKLLNHHQSRLPAAPTPIDAPIETIARVIPSDWTDYNGHMNEGRYGQIFSDAADDMMRRVGVDKAYIAAGFSFFTVDIHIKFLRETLAGQTVRVKSQIVEAAGKKMQIFHSMEDAGGTQMATAEQLLIHVDLNSRRACAPGPELGQKLHDMAAAHAHLAPRDAG